jgi:hypothetical protein
MVRKKTVRTSGVNLPAPLVPTAKAFLGDKPMGIEAPRGSIVISGLVEVVGSQANITIDLSSCYDLLEDRFLFKFLKIRRVALHKQRPEGGP